MKCGDCGDEFIGWEGKEDTCPKYLKKIMEEEESKLHKKDYKIIYADPAWVYKDKANAGNRGACHKYTLTPTEEMGEIIKNIPVDKDSICLMWCTYPQLKEGLKLMELWGFEFKTVAFTWVKKNKVSDSFFMGMGRHTRGNPEIVLLGKKGKGVPRINCGIRNLQIHKIREHSRKPDEIRKEIVNLYGDVPRIELFARELKEGFDVWGNETGKFANCVSDEVKK